MEDILGEMLTQNLSAALSQTKSSFIGVVNEVKAPYASVRPMARIGNKKQTLVEKALISLPAIIVAYTDTKGNKHQLAPKVSIKQGDHVLCVVSDDDTSHYSANKDEFNVFKKQPHSIEDAVIVGKIATKDDFK